MGNCEHSSTRTETSTENKTIETFTPDGRQLSIPYKTVKVRVICNACGAQVSYGEHTERA